jgi:hypothetical protein
VGLNARAAGSWSRSRRVRVCPRRTARHCCCCPHTDNSTEPISGTAPAKLVALSARPRQGTHPFLGTNTCSMLLDSSESLQHSGQAAADYHGHSQAPKKYHWSRRDSAIVGSAAVSGVALTVCKRRLSARREKCRRHRRRGDCHGGDLGDDSKFGIESARRDDPRTFLIRSASQEIDDSRAGINHRDRQEVETEGENVGARPATAASVQIQANHVRRPCFGW